ncbi:MAG: NHL repeat-containing protein [Chloroflexota bacterium]
MVAGLAGMAGLALPAGPAEVDAANGGAGAGGGPEEEAKCLKGKRGKKKRCRKHTDCCTGYCKKIRKRKNGKVRKTRRCRCAPAGFVCSAKTRCCGGMTCASGTCGKAPNPGGCGAGTCRAGCCEAGICKPGSDAGARGTAGDACAACSGDTDTCTGGSCTCGGGAACSGAAPYCASGACVECVSSNDCSGCKPYCSTQTGVCSGAFANQTKIAGDTSGSATDKFNEPSGMAISPDELTLWVADKYNYRISVWSRPDTGANKNSWSNETTFGTQGSTASDFNAPYDVAVTPDGLTALVADTDNHRISVWTRPDTGANKTNWTNQTTFGGPNSGSSTSEFNTPTGVFVSADGLTLWVADKGNSRISVWTRPDTGANKTAWANETTFGGAGSSADKFDQPTGVAVTANGLTVWVSDQLNNRVSVWTRPDTGANKKDWRNQATYGNGAGAASDQFLAPLGITVAQNGLTMWVSDYNYRVSQWGAPVQCP